MTRTLVGTLIAILALSGGAAIAGEGGGGPKMIDCEMTFSLKGWSAFYKTAKGEGTITCDNGQSASVKIKTKGGGLTVGKSEIANGRGKFSEAESLDELFGRYVQAEAHAGAVKSSAAQAMTKGEISLALSGTGRGWDLGVSFGAFTIERAGGGKKKGKD